MVCTSAATAVGSFSCLLAEGGAWIYDNVKLAEQNLLGCSFQKPCWLRFLPPPSYLCFWQSILLHLSLFPSTQALLYRQMSETWKSWERVRETLQIHMPLHMGVTLEKGARRDGAHLQCQQFITYPGCGGASLNLKSTVAYCLLT